MPGKRVRVHLCRVREEYLHRFAKSYRTHQVVDAHVVIVVAEYQQDVLDAAGYRQAVDGFDQIVDAGVHLENKRDRFRRLL